MLVRAAFLIILFVIISCGQFKQDDKSDINNNLEILPNDISTHNIIGNWCGENLNMPAFEIKQDSIYFFSNNTSYPYKHDGDTFSVKFSDRDTFTIWGITSIIEDTLFFRDSDNSILKAFHCK